VKKEVYIIDGNGQLRKIELWGGRAYR
jgi:hypothetical protein